MLPTRLALVCDFPEERWPSMDLVAEMVLTYLGREHADRVAATRVCPPFRHRLTRWPMTRWLSPARNADRVLNRFWDYPRTLGHLARRGSSTSSTWSIIAMLSSSTSCRQGVRSSPATTSTASAAFWSRGASPARAGSAP